MPRRTSQILYQESDLFSLSLCLFCHFTDGWGYIFKLQNVRTCSHRRDRMDSKNLFILVYFYFIFISDFSRRNLQSFQKKKKKQDCIILSLKYCSCFFLISYYSLIHLRVMLFFHTFCFLCHFSHWIYLFAFQLIFFFSFCFIIYGTLKCSIKGRIWV